MDETEKLKKLLELNYLKSEVSLEHYTKQAWKVLEPDVTLQWNWHHSLICEYLTAARLGQITRLIINVCPRSTKSTISSICFPTWIWTENPAERFLFGCYADDLATKQSILRRTLIKSDWYHTGWGQRFNLSEDEDTKKNFTNNRTGQMKSSGIKGSVTGEGGNYIIIDDPHNPKGVESELELQSTLQNFDLAWSSRLNDKKTGRIIVIMQRLRDNDLSGHLLAKDLGYVHVKIPTIAEERQRVVFPVSHRVVEREQGDFMHPSRDGQKEIDQAKKDLGPYGFSGQHQQNPTPATGGLFTPQMFDFVEMPDSFEWGFITGDTAYTEKAENDFTVFTAWGVRKGELFIRDVYRKQILAVDIERDAAPFLKRFLDWGFRGVYIEPKGHGLYLNQTWARAPHSIMIPSERDIKEFYKDRTADKVIRANNAVPWLANRVIHINKYVSEKETLLSEVLSFPKGNHDDFTDTVIDGIKVAFGRSPSILDVL